MVSWIQCNHIATVFATVLLAHFPSLHISATGRRCDSTSQSPPGPETRDGHVQICWFQISNDPWFWKFRWFAGGDPKKMLSEMRQGSLELWGVNRNLKQGEKQKNKQEVFFWISLNTEYVVSALPGAHWYWPSRLSILLGRYLSASRRPQRVFEGFWNFIQLEFLPSSEYAEFELPHVTLVIFNLAAGGGVQIFVCSSACFLQPVSRRFYFQ